LKKKQLESCQEEKQNILTLEDIKEQNSEKIAKLETEKQKCEKNLLESSALKQRVGTLETTNKESSGKIAQLEKDKKEFNHTLKQKEKESILRLIGVGLLGGTVCLIFVCCWRHSESKIGLYTTPVPEKKEEKGKGTKRNDPKKNQ